MATANISRTASGSVPEASMPTKGDDADEADDQAGAPAPVEALVGAEEAVADGGDQRRGGDEQTGE
jgi:hypothetical protein